MDHVASGWNGRKSNNIIVPDEETCMSSGQYWPQSCQGGPTLGLEELLRIRGDDGRGWIQDFLFREFF